MPKSAQKPLYLDETYEHRKPTRPSKSSNHAHIRKLPREWRRKLGRACVFCQRSHLTCEEQRPCARCVKRGIADECKKDHYAQQVDEKRLLKQQDCEESSLRQKRGEEEGSISMPLTKQKSLEQDSQMYRNCTQINTKDLNVEKESGSSHGKTSQPTSTAFSSEDWNSALFSSFFYDEDITSTCQPFCGDSRLGGATNPFYSDSTFFNRYGDTLSDDVSLMHPSMSNQETSTPSEETYGLVYSNAQSADVMNGFDRSLATQQKKDKTQWFEPLTYEKGYASILQYLKQQSWSLHNVDQVIKVLSSVRDLWRSKETTMQLTDVVQVQVLWATNYNLYRSYILPHTPIATIVCRKAGEVYAANKAAYQLLDVPSSELEDGQRAIYEFFTQTSSAHFFSLYEQAVYSQISSNSATAEVTLHWNAELVATKTLPSQDSRIKMRGVFHMKFSPQNLPCLLLISLIPL